MADPTPTDPASQTATTQSSSTDTQQPSSSTTDSSSTTQPTAPTCAHCGKTPDSPKQCLKCHSVTYCNKDCQKNHFKQHKKVCAGLAQEYVKLHEPKMASRSSGGGRGEGPSRGLQKWQFDT